MSHPALPGADHVKVASSLLFTSGRSSTSTATTPLLADYDLLAGRIWVLVLLTLLVGPAVAGAVMQRARAIAGKG